MPADVCAPQTDRLLHACGCLRMPADACASKHDKLLVCPRMPAVQNNPFLMPADAYGCLRFQKPQVSADACRCLRMLALHKTIGFCMPADACGCLRMPSLPNAISFLLCLRMPADACAPQNHWLLYACGCLRMPANACASKHTRCLVCLRMPAHASGCQRRVRGTEEDGHFQWA